MRRREFLKLSVTAIAATSPIGMAVIGELRRSLPGYMQGSIHVSFDHTETRFKFYRGHHEIKKVVHKYNSPFVKLASRA